MEWKVRFWSKKTKTGYKKVEEIKMQRQKNEANIPWERYMGLLKN